MTGGDDADHHMGQPRSRAEGTDPRRGHGRVRAPRLLRRQPQRRLPRGGRRQGLPLPVLRRETRPVRLRRRTDLAAGPGRDAPLARRIRRHRALRRAHARRAVRLGRLLRRPSTGARCHRRDQPGDRPGGTAGGPHPRAPGVRRRVAPAAGAGRRARRAGRARRPRRAAVAADPAPPHLALAPFSPGLEAVIELDPDGADLPARVARLAAPLLAYFVPVRIPS